MITGDEDMDNKIYYFLFFVDISGSMLGKNISVVNAAIAEAINVIQQSNVEKKCNVQIGIYSFNDKVYTVTKLNSIEYVTSPILRIVPDKEGFYSLSSFNSLYNGMNELFNRMKYDANRDCVFLFVASDGKATDIENDIIIHSLRNNPIYQNAEKYISLPDLEWQNVQNNVKQFVENNSSNAISLEQLPDLIAKLQVLIN